MGEAVGLASGDFEGLFVVGLRDGAGDGLNVVIIGLAVISFDDGASVDTGFAVTIATGAGVGSFGARVGANVNVATTSIGAGEGSAVGFGVTAGSAGASGSGAGSGTGTGFAIGSGISTFVKFCVGTPS